MATEYLLQYSNEGRWPQWYCDPFRSLEEVCEWLEDGILGGHTMISVIGLECIDHKQEFRGDFTSEVLERLKQRDRVRCEKEWMRGTYGNPDLPFETYYELEARF